jgi:hypothetical protein
MRIVTVSSLAPVKNSSATRVTRFGITSSRWSRARKNSTTFSGFGLMTAM